MSLAWPAVAQLLVFIYSGIQWSWFSFTLAYNGVGREYSSLFIVVVDLFFVFSLWCVGWVFVCFCMKSSVGTRGGVCWLWGALGPPPPPPGGLLCRPFWGGGPGVGLALCCFVVCSAGRFVVCLSVCHFVLVFFGPFGVAIASLGEGGGVGGASLGAFRAFVRFVLVCVCRFPLPLGVWEGLRFVIVALPGLFSYLF